MKRPAMLAGTTAGLLLAGLAVAQAPRHRSVAGWVIEGCGGFTFRPWRSRP
jgi:hypothetical protein